MILNIPSELMTSFKTHGAKELSKVAAFHESLGNEGTVQAVEMAESATLRL